MSKLNRRKLISIELKEAMGEALLKLIKEKPLDKITVDEFTKEANVGRATYYRQFKSKQDVISYKLNRDWLKYSEKNNLSSDKMNPLDYSAAFFNYIYSMRETNRILIESGCKLCIFDAMQFSFEDVKNPADSKKYYRDKFRSHGLFGLVDGWIESDYNLSVQQISELAVELFYKI